MKFNTVTQTLLHENPKALQFLHYASGFDFNSPFHVSSGTGRFTFNKVMAQVSSVIKGPVNVALFVKVNNSYLRDFITFLWETPASNLQSPVCGTPTTIT